jgi:hypothetical protein
MLIISDDNYAVRGKRAPSAAISDTPKTHLAFPSNIKCRRQNETLHTSTGREQLSRMQISQKSTEYVSERPREMRKFNGLKKLAKCSYRQHVHV